MMTYGCLFFLFKQKTAYEMRISDWSSDVCSSDLGADADPIGLGLVAAGVVDLALRHQPLRRHQRGHGGVVAGIAACALGDRDRAEHRQQAIGSASCRERVCQYVLVSVVAVSIKQ